MGKHAIPVMPYLVGPSANNLLAWVTDPACCSTGRTPLAANIHLVKIPTPKTITIANLIVTVSTAGNNYSNAQLGVYSSAGVLLGASAVLASGGTNTFGATGTAVVPITVIGGQSLTIPGSPTGFVWAAVHLGTNSATAVILIGLNTTSGVINAGLSAATLRATRQAGHATNPLATIGNLTPASNNSTFDSNNSASIIWIGVS